MPETYINSIQNTSRRFLRSTDLVRDFDDPKGLQDYWLTDFCRTCLAQIADGFRLDSGRRAWRLTGDFGSGKSSFALLLATVLRDPKRLPEGLRDRVFQTAPETKGKQFQPVLVAGSREPVALAILRSLHQLLSGLYTRGSKSALLEEMETALRKGKSSDKRTLEFVSEANAKLIQSGKGDGILLILDEAGKFLEFAAMNPEQQDVYFLQQLAETASRSGKHPLMVLCLFHQGFSAYAEQLTKTTQQEWNKIAGRYDEIVFHQPLDQVAQLTAGALGNDLQRLPRTLSKTLAASMEQAIKFGWYGTSSSRETLRDVAARLFPIDPMLLPVLIRFFRRFGQNERSLFGFLFSHEPFGLHAFSSQQTLNGASHPYQIADFYDYVRVNFGHRLGAASYRAHWNIIESTIEAFQPEHPHELDLRILKTVGLLNLLNVDEFVPTEEAVAWAVAGDSPEEQRSVASLLKKIANTPAMYFRGKGRGYSIWAHTSVDLDARLEEARKMFSSVGSVADAIATMLPEAPIVARAHYIKSGNLRFFDVVYCQPGEIAHKAEKYATRADGFILIPLCESAPETKACEQAASHLSTRTDLIRLIAVPKPLTNLHQAILDVQHWEWVQHNTLDLNNDPIARMEVTNYVQEARYRLQGQVQSYLGLNRYAGESSLKWYYTDHEGKACVEWRTSRGVLELLSSLCDTVYAQAPIVKNELVNRHNISSAAAGARMRLIELMFTTADQPDLGMPADRKPPEKSMYFSVLKKAKLHRPDGTCWKIAIPDKGVDQDPSNLRPALNRIKKLLALKPDTRIPITTILDDLRRPPYGLRDGLFPILITAIAIDGAHEIAFYESGTFLRDVGRDAFLRMTKAPDKFEIQLCRVEGVRTSLFQQLAKVLELSSTGKDVEMLDVVRNLCQFIARLPEYSRNTRRIDATALAVRDVILQAREPVRMVFHDLPEACGWQKFAIGQTASTDEAHRFVATLKHALDELRTAFPNLQRRIETGLAYEFGYAEQKVWEYRPKLAERAEKLLVRVTENKLKAFAFRLFDESLPEPDWLGSVGSVLTLRPPDKWKDEDEDTFERELANLSGRFKRTESVTFTHGGGKGVRVAITQADGTERQEVVQIEAGDDKLMHDLQTQIMTVIKKNRRLGIAAASQAIWAQIREIEEK